MTNVYDKEVFLFEILSYRNIVLSCSPGWPVAGGKIRFDKFSNRWKAAGFKGGLLSVHSKSSFIGSDKFTLFVSSVLLLVTCQREFIEIRYRVVGYGKNQYCVLDTKTEKVAK